MQILYPKENTELSRGCVCHIVLPTVLHERKVKPCEFRLGAGLPPILRRALLHLRKLYERKAARDAISGDLPTCLRLREALRFAAKCSLGVIGDHGMLITADASSFTASRRGPCAGLSEDELSGRRHFKRRRQVSEDATHCGECRRQCPGRCRRTTKADAYPR